MYRLSANIRKYSTTPVVEIITDDRGNDTEKIVFVCCLPKNEGNELSNRIIELLNKQIEDMGKFEFEEKKYTIVKENKGEADICDWEEKVTDVTREREIFAWRPWLVGKKFRWLKKITVKESLRFVRYSGFDDGWTYQNYWKPWKMDWEVIEILS